MDALPQAVAQLLEGSVDAAVVLDGDRRIIYFNRAYEALARVRGRKLWRQVERGARCYDVFPLEICQSACVGCSAREAGKPLRVDEIRAASDDEEKTFIVTAVPLDDDYVIETYRDVTDNVRIQRRLKVLLERERRAKIDLEETVAERTKELRVAQAQLVLQEKMSALGRLVAGIAHELNNPINFVYGNVDFLHQYVENLISLVELVDEAELPPALREAFERRKGEIEFDFLISDSVKLIRSIRSGAERTASIVRDLKNFSRTGSGDRQETDLIQGIESTLNLIAPLLKNRIEIQRDYEADLPKVVCNASHINQVFMNILTNAAQAIEGAGWIRIAVDCVDDGKRVRIAISDSGPGVSDEIRAKITDPFFTTKDVGEGTGLGLWITQNVVQSHGGEFLLDTVAGHGATFTVILPVEPVSSAEPDAELATERHV